MGSLPQCPFSGGIPRICDQPLANKGRGRSRQMPGKGHGMPDNITSSAMRMVEEYRLVPQTIGAPEPAGTQQNAAHPRMLIAEEHRWIATGNGPTVCAGTQDNAASPVVLIAE